LLDTRRGNATIELGNIWFSYRLARSRAATEAIGLLLRHAFDDLGYRHVVWKCDAQHGASRRCAERIGFSYEGTLRAYMRVRGTLSDTALYSLLEEEWAERRAALNTSLTPANFDECGGPITRLRRSA
jgi:RimJ/RimL family protein N-acetyltransferase